MAVYRIEIANSGNSPVLWNPLRMRLRGRWNQTAGTGRGMHESMAKLCESLATVGGSIPGIVVFADPDRRTVGYYDPLSREASKVYEAILPILKAYPETFSNDISVWPENMIENVNDDDLKTWLYQMQQAVVAKAAVKVDDSPALPGVDEIRAMTGRIRQNFGTPYTDEDTKESSWAHEVKANGRGNGGRQTAGAGAGAGDGNQK